MNRRNYLNLVGTSIAPAVLGGSKDSLKRTDSNCSNGERPSLEEFLLLDEDVPSNYKLCRSFPQFPSDSRITEDDGTLFTDAVVKARWNPGRSISYTRAERAFEWHKKTENGRGLFGDIQTIAMMPQPSEKTTERTTAADLHNSVLNKWFNGPLKTDVLTDWCDMEIQEIEHPKRRTQAWVRLPILNRNKGKFHVPTNERPMEEWALEVATAEWGVLALAHSISCPPEPRKSLKTARTQMNRLLDRVRHARAPLVERGELA